MKKRCFATLYSCTTSCFSCSPRQSDVNVNTSIENKRVKHEKGKTAGLHYCLAWPKERARSARYFKDDFANTWSWRFLALVLYKTQMAWVGHPMLDTEDGRLSSLMYVHGTGNLAILLILLPFVFPLPLQLKMGTYRTTGDFFCFFFFNTNRN